LGVYWLAFVLQSFFGALLCISFTSWVLMSLCLLLMQKEKQKADNKNWNRIPMHFFGASILFCYWRYTQQICIWILQSSNPKTLCSVFFFFGYSD
jgi:hypothetical protein